MRATATGVVDATELDMAIDACTNVPVLKPVPSGNGNDVLEIGVEVDMMTLDDGDDEGDDDDGGDGNGTGTGNGNGGGGCFDTTGTAGDFSNIGSPFNSLVVHSYVKKPAALAGNARATHGPNPFHRPR